jgi:hypothetical protein
MIALYFRDDANSDEQEIKLKRRNERKRRGIFNSEYLIDEMERPLFPDELKERTGYDSIKFILERIRNPLKRTVVLSELLDLDEANDLPESYVFTHLKMARFAQVMKENEDLILGTEEDHIKVKNAAENYMKVVDRYVYEDLVWSDAFIKKARRKVIDVGAGAASAVQGLLGLPSSIQNFGEYVARKSMEAAIPNIRYFADSSFKGLCKTAQETYMKWQSQEVIDENTLIELIKQKNRVKGVVE